MDISNHLQSILTLNEQILEAADTSAYYQVQKQSSEIFFKCCRKGYFYSICVLCIFDCGYC